MLREIKLRHVLLASIFYFNMEHASLFTQFTRNQSLLEFTLNCTGAFLSSEAECVMTAFEKDKGIAIFNSDSLTCQMCREDDSGDYVSRIGDVAWSECLFHFKDTHTFKRHLIFLALFISLIGMYIVQKVMQTDFLPAEIKCPLRSSWSQPDDVSISLQPSFFVSFDSTTCFPLADFRISTGKGKVPFR